MKFAIFYMTSNAFRQLSFGDILPTLDTLAETHAELMNIDAPDLPAVFGAMQAHAWAEDWQACNALLESKGLAHTSMSVGDIARDETGVYYVVANIGWIPLAAAGSQAEALAKALNEATTRRHANYKPGASLRRHDADDTREIAGTVSGFSSWYTMNGRATFCFDDGSRFAMPVRGF